MRFNGVMLGSENVKALAEFYTKVLGKPSFQDGDWYGFGTKDVSIMLGPHSEVKGKNQDAPRIMLFFEVEDVKAETERLKGVGAEVIAEPYQPEGGNGMWLATFADLDGNYFQISTPWEE